MKKIIFVSHIHEEKELALLIKKLIEDSFLGMIEVFVSSDSGSNAMGDRWLDNISHTLKNCSVEIVICSSKSIMRPWIHFEAGAGWVREIPVIPVCHSGLTPSKLPLPLNLLNAVTASDLDSLKNILPVMSKALGSNVPTVDLPTLVGKIREFEQNYTFWDACNSSFEELRRIFGENSDNVMKLLRENKTVEMPRLSADVIPRLQAATSFLSEHRVLSFSGPLAAAYGPTGATHLCRLVPGARLHEILSDARFRL